MELTIDSPENLDDLAAEDARVRALARIIRDTIFIDSGTGGCRARRNGKSAEGTGCRSTDSRVERADPQRLDPDIGGRGYKRVRVSETASRG